MIVTTRVVSNEKNITKSFGPKSPAKSMEMNKGF